MSLWACALAAGCILLVCWDLVVVVAAALRVRLPKTPPSVETGPPVVVLVPCKGDGADARAFFQHLMAQRYRPFRVILAVESAADAALTFLRLPGMAERTEVAVAELAQNCSQKVANLRAGLARVRADDAILVQADADHLPPPDWLGQLVQPLLAGSADVVSGYRLMIPDPPGLGSCVTAALDNGIATALRPVMHRLCWGGCIAARRETWERVRYREELEGSLNDDIMVSALFSKARLRVAMPRHMLLPVSAGHSVQQLLNFVPRQYMQVRWYAPFFRWFAHLLLPLPPLAWGAAIIAAITGYDWGLAALGFGYAAALAKALLRRSLVRKLAGPAVLPRWRCVFWLTFLAAPALAFLHYGLGRLGLVKREVVWAGTRYRIGAPKQVTVVERLAA